jgi:hypothetical protein
MPFAPDKTIGLDFDKSAYARKLVEAEKEWLNPSPVSVEELEQIMSILDDL